jgi:hypothetical protein
MQLLLFYIVFILCNLTSYSIGLMQISNYAKLIMADGVYKSL